MNNKKQTEELRKDVTANIIKAFIEGDFDISIDKIPFEMRPKNCEVSYRCCIHKERAILRARTISGLGFAIENDDEIKPLSKYAKESLEREAPDNNILTVVDTACQGCTPSRIFVTDICQGCVARPCKSSCPVDAISIMNGKAIIDSHKCINCTRCVSACPYNAIAKIVVPCEDVCPVDAIRKNEDGFAEINFDKCISCGACISSCPFGAVAEKSQIIDILKHIKNDKKVIAMLAPSVVGQLPTTIGKISSAFIKTGFSKVYEVAQGADITATHEEKDFGQRQQKGDKFMTTSCCAAYNELVAKHVVEMTPFVSETKTPAFYTAEIVKKENPECISVFVGPCPAKRKEGLNDDNIDYVMTFEEMNALFDALKIDLNECSEYAFKTPSSTQGRNFGVSGGVAQSVISASKNTDSIKPTYINGINKDTIRKLKKYANQKSCDDGNLIEVMSCQGGCVGGSCTLNNKSITSRQIKEYAKESFELGDKT